MIEVSGLTKYYGSRPAIRDISFTVPGGEVIGLLGLNGAGKSTTMNILAGCLARTSGKVLLDGVDIADNPEQAKKNIGYLPEIPPLYTDMKVREYLDFVCELKQIKGNRKTHLAEIVRSAGLEAVYERLIKNLSKGYKQRTGLAAALAGSPRILILDEPTAGLDPGQIIEIRNLIKSLGESRTVIFSSHILSEVKAVCGRVIVLNRGTIAADDSPENLAGNGSSYIVTVECGGAEDAEKVLRAVPGALEVKLLEQEQDGVYTYALTGEKNRDMRRDISLALSGGGLVLLAARRGDPAFEHIFLELINAEKGEP